MAGSQSRRGCNVPSVAIDFVSGVAPTQEVYSLMIGAGYAILLGVVPRISAVFVFTTSTLMLRTGVVYRWVSFLGYAIAVVMLVVPVLSSPSGVGLPIWVAIASIVLFVRNAKMATDSAQSAPADGGPAVGQHDVIT